MTKPWIIRWTANEVVAAYRLHDVMSAIDLAEFVAADVIDDLGPNKHVSISIPTTIFGSRPVILYATDSDGASTPSAAVDIDFGRRPPREPKNLTGEPDNS